LLFSKGTNVAENKDGKERLHGHVLDLIKITVPKIIIRFKHCSFDIGLECIGGFFGEQIRLDGQGAQIKGEVGGVKNLRVLVVLQNLGRFCWSQVARQSHLFHRHLVGKLGVLNLAASNDAKVLALHANE